MANSNKGNRAELQRDIFYPGKLGLHSGKKINQYGVAWFEYWASSIDGYIINTFHRKHVFTIG